MHGNHYQGQEPGVSFWILMGHTTNGTNVGENNPSSIPCSLFLIINFFGSNISTSMLAGPHPSLNLISLSLWCGSQIGTTQITNPTDAIHIYIDTFSKIMPQSSRMAQHLTVVFIKDVWDRDWHLNFRWSPNRKHWHIPQGILARVSFHAWRLTKDLSSLIHTCYLCPPSTTHFLFYLPSSILHALQERWWCWVCWMLSAEWLCWLLIPRRKGSVRLTKKQRKGQQVSLLFQSTKISSLQFIGLAL